MPVRSRSRSVQPSSQTQYVLFGSAIIFFLSNLLYLHRRAELLSFPCFPFHINSCGGDTQEGGASSNSNRHVHHNASHATTLAEARSYKLAPVVNNKDKTQYTIRMNTWRRNEQLLISINHHAKCEGVAIIQLIWCDQVNNPPEEVLHHESGKVQIEKHDINSLNERFRILTPAPTLGILSLDDDVLRPCEALDAAFIRWTRNPSRIVGFDARSHHIDRKMNNPNDKVEFAGAAWEYGMPGASNTYSITLPSKACFLHRDYLDLYIAVLPRPIYQHIDKHFECEDVAMSYFVSTLTEGKPPLLSDYWASSSVVELYTRNGISWKDGHLNSRNVCVNDFAEYLGLKEGDNSKESGIVIQSLRSGKLHQNSLFAYGDEPEQWTLVDSSSFPAPRLQSLVKVLQWRKSLNGQENMNNTDWLQELETEMTSEARKAGLVKGTIEWKLRWLYNCATDLGVDKQTKSCFAKPQSTELNASFFVCDITEGVLHHVDGSKDWMIAGPPKGTGTHEYVAFVGELPCKNIGRCSGCLSPKGMSICSAKIDPEDCSMEVASSNGAT